MTAPAALIPPEGSLWNEPAYVLLARTASPAPTPAAAACRLSRARTAWRSS